MFNDWLNRAFRKVVRLEREKIKCKQEFEYSRYSPLESRVKRSNVAS
jgi:hypothetical protein